MFYEWVAAGAAFGIKAFFAVVVFFLIAGGLIGLVGLIAGLLGGIEKEDDPRV